MFEVTTPTTEDRAIYTRLITGKSRADTARALVAAVMMHHNQLQAVSVSANLPLYAAGSEDPAFNVARMVRNRIFNNVGDMSAKSVY